MPDVALIDGRVVPSDSMDWRWETLARAVLRSQLEARREFIAAWEKRHGEASANKLRELMTGQFAHDKAAVLAAGHHSPQPERDPTLEWK